MPQTTGQEPKTQKVTTIKKPEQKQVAQAVKKEQPVYSKPATNPEIQPKPAAQVKVWKRNETSVKEVKAEAKKETAPSNNRLDTKALLRGLEERK